MNIVLIFLISFIIGTGYYFIMENSIPKESNCSFISSIWTDILAFIVSIIIIYRGNIHKDSIIIGIGFLIIVEHIWQLFPKLNK